MPAQHYCLRWKNHHSNVQNMFTQLLEKDRFCDVRILCAGVELRAHRAVLASCSALLAALLLPGGAAGGAPEPPSEAVLLIDGAEPDDVAALLRYMYTGEISVHHTQLTSLLKTAEELRIKGLAEIRWTGPSAHDIETSTQHPSDSIPMTNHNQSDDKLNRAEDYSSSNKSEKVDALSDCDAASKRADDEEVHENGKPSSHAEERTLVIPSSCSVINGGPPPLRWITEKTKTSNASCQTDDDKKRILQEANTLTTDSDACVSPKRMKTDTPQLIQKLNQDSSKWSSSQPTKQYIPTNAIKSEPDLNIDEDRDGDAGESDEAEEYDGSAHDITQFLDTSFREGDDDMSDGCELLPTAHNRLSPIPGQSHHMPLSPTGAGPIAGLLAQVGVTITSNAKGDPRFRDVIKLNDYLRNGRRPQFWEEDYVLRVMEAVRSKELEMKQAAEILGVSYGTLYGRYRDVYGCINRPYRSRDFWTEQGGSEILLRLRRGEVPLAAAAEALGVAPPVLAAYVSRLGESNAGMTSDEGEPSREAPTPVVTPAPTQQSGEQRRGRPPRVLAPATLNANYASSLAAAVSSAPVNNIGKRTSTNMGNSSMEEQDPLASSESAPVQTSATPSLTLHTGRRGRPPRISNPSAGTYVPPPIAPHPAAHDGSVKAIRRNVSNAEMAVRKLLTTYDNKPFRIAEREVSKSPRDSDTESTASSNLEANVSILRSRPELTIITPGKKDSSPSTSGHGNVT